MVGAMGGTSVSLGIGIAVSVFIGVSICAGDVSKVDVGKMSGIVGGICVGVAGEEGIDSASDKNIPPITNIKETIPIITPPPNWRRDCMIISPRLSRARSWQSAAAR